jgi:hypothetical protein
LDTVVPECSVLAAVESLPEPFATWHWRFDFDNTKKGEHWSLSMAGAGLVMGPVESCGALPGRKRRENNGPAPRSLVFGNHMFSELQTAAS